MASRKQKQTQKLNRAGAAANPMDSDRDSDSSDDDKEFAAKMMSMKKGDQSLMFKRKSQTAASSSSAQSQKLSAHQKVIGGSLMELDDFKVPGTSKSKQNSHPYPTSLHWPLEKYDFHLACQLCYRREGEGVNGYIFQPSHPHKCPYNILIVRSKGNISRNWMKVRPRPNTDTYFQAYKLCDFFKRGDRCRMGEASCTFAHNYVEIDLWNKDRDKDFHIANFIKAAQQEGAVSSEILETRHKKHQQSPKKQNIVKESVSNVKEPDPLKTAAMQYQPQIKQIKIPVAHNKPTVPSPLPSMDTSRPPPFLLPPSLAPTFSSPPPSFPGNFPVSYLSTGLPPNQPQMATKPTSYIKSPPQPGSYKSSSVPHKRHDMPVVMIENPLPRYHFELCCKLCLRLRSESWLYEYDSILTHSCAQNVLAYCIKDQIGQNSWVKVRERASHRDFAGNYVLCHSVTGNKRSVCKHLDNCSFAHSLIEKQLWGLEKSGQFNISEFILQRQGKLSTKGNMSADSVQELIDMYGGYFRYVCRKCFFSETPHISSKGDGLMCAGKEKHNWESSFVLAHVNNSKYTVIDGRKLVHQGAYYKLCKFLNFCYMWSTDACIFAHSKIEMSVWRLERDKNIPRNEIVKESSNIYVKGHYKQSEAGITAEGNIGVEAEEARPGLTPVHRGMEEPPVRIGEFCRTCWGNGQKSQQDGEKDRCTKGHSNYKLNSTFIALLTAKEVRSLPPNLPQGMKFMLCHLANKCQKKICTFPHSQEEMDVWTYMSKYSIKKLSEVALKCQEIEKAKSRKINTGELVVNIGSSQAPAWTSQAKPASHIIAPGDLDISEFYCPYCSITCNNQSQWDDHLASSKHQNTVLWDKEHPWNYRQPPWGQTDSLMICASHLYNRSCRYSAVPDMYNLCKYAHSQEELDEWKERHEFRKMKRKMAIQRHMFSYTESLMEQYNTSDKTANVLNESVPGVVVKCDQVSSVFKKEKNASHLWTFTVHSKKMLEKVALLRNQDRLHFHLKTPDGSQHQVCAGNSFMVVNDTNNKNAYRIQVSFTAGLFGSFSQWLSLDFGSKPVLIRKLVADVGQQSCQQTVQELRKNLDFSRWTPQNREIVRSSVSVSDDFDVELLCKYKEPVSVEDIVTTDSLKELNRHNYVHKMHKLLDLEEITRHRLIASYNGIMEVNVSNHIEEFGYFIQGQNGQLFLKVPLVDVVTEDTDAGKLLLTSVTTALITLAHAQSHEVYEANVVQEFNYGYDGWGREEMYLAVSQSIASALGLVAGEKTQLEIQFQLDRLAFCRMHFALDNLVGMDMVFPDVLKFKPCIGRGVSVSSSVLNDDQMTAVRHIVIDRDIYSPPFIMYGPFGTGKTETLAQATMSLLMDKKPCRVLICTQSNSAADLYITKHFDDFQKKSNGQYKILRILDHRRKVSTVSEAVFPYCFTDENNQFGVPPKENILQQEVILMTVESSIQLSRIGLHGTFTHIFVDEAGQTLECGVLMPLCLASSKTCVVLTGDHLQISPPVYSLAAKEQNFDVPILVRLFNYYDEMARGPITDSVVDMSQKSPLKIQLSINYRTKSEILRFISTVFYGGPDILKAYSKLPSVLHITPLAFFSVQGKESQSSDCSSYMNPLEAVEVVSQVKVLLDEWPQEWGPQSPQSVAIITNYRDQVKYIRQMLKSSSTKKQNLRRVFVDTIQGVQGKEFRAVFISTVRTTNLLQESHIHQALEEDRDIGDLGFLSNPKLLNTALTRAQSFVGVVGDPVALCLVGDCIQEWRTYIKHCSNLKSIHPNSYTYDFVRNQVLQLQVSGAGQIVDKLSKQKEEKMHQSFPPLAPPSSSEKVVVPLEHEEGEERVGEVPPFFPTFHDTNGQREDRSHFMDSMEMFFQQPLPNIIPSFSLPNNNQVPEKRQHNLNGESLSITNEVSTEDIVFQLVKENISGLADRLLIKSEYIQVMEKDGFAVLSYSQEKNPESQPFKITTYDEDFVTFSVYEKDSEVTVDYENWSVEKLHAQIGKPGYLRCRIAKNEDRIVAVALPPNPRETRQAIDWTGKQVEFSHQFDSGHGLVGDEVLVKLSDKTTPGKLTGQVKGILRSADDKNNCLLICKVSVIEPGILKPVDRNHPCLYSLTSMSRYPLAQKGHVPVYQFTHLSGIEFSHYEKINSKSDQQNLLVVRYLTWPSKLSLPVGLVVGSLKPGVSLDLGMKILSIEHDLWRPLHHQAEQEAERVFADNFSVTDAMVQGRVNLSNSFCFTITEEDVQDVEMALHMEQTEDNYTIGIHVSDVTTFISKDSVLDRECEQRSPSLFPCGREPRHMLPVQACTGLCSLQLDLDRFAISVLMTMDATGRQVGDLQVFRSIINVKQQYTLSKVQNILLDCDVETTPDTDKTSDYYKSCLVTLYMLSTFWRNQRLGSASFASSVLPGQLPMQHAQQMLDEIKHHVNTAVAFFLESSFPQCIPLLVQPAPNHDKLDKWRRESAGHAFNCIPMSCAFLDKQVCHCKQMCTCVFGFMRAHQLQPSQQVVILKEAWHALCEAGSPDDFDAEKAKDIISDVKNLPQLSLCNLKFASIKQQEHFVCSGLVSEHEKENYELSVSSYTLFTSPIRHFIGIVIQRLLLAHLEGAGSPYTTQEIAELCAQASSHHCQKLRLDSQSLRLHLGIALQTHPLSVMAIVEKTGPEAIVLSLRGIHEVCQEDRTVALWDLQPVKAIVQYEDCVKVHWEERSYQYSGGNSQNRSDTVEVVPNQSYVYSIPSNRWQHLLMMTRKMVSLDAGEDEFTSFSNHLKDMTRVLESQLSDSKNVPVSQDSVMRHHASFSLMLHPSHCLVVQLGARLSQGLMAPSIMLIELTPQLDICLEHRSDPQTCFCVAQTSAPTDNCFMDINSYQNYWLPQLVSGSAQEAVKDGDRMTIHSVSLTWSFKQTPGLGQQMTCGELLLSKHFCSKNKIFLEEGTSNELDIEMCLAFMCVRYKNMDLDECQSPDPNVKVLVNANHKVTWVGHCTVTQIKHTKDNVQIQIRLVQSNFAIPGMLLERDGHKILGTMEWIGKGKLYSVLDETVRKLHTSSQFAQDVVLGRKPANSIEPIEMPKGMYLEHLSATQQMALGDSYSDPFSFVLGGPGTGKSILASCLAALLVFRNAKLDKLHQVQSSGGPLPNTQLMVCAPTEHSLDVLTGYIRTLNQDMNLVRVYSEEVEESDFPTALKPSGPRGDSDVQKCVVMKDIALHHLIRTPGKSRENDNLLHQEMLMSMYGEDPFQVSALRSAKEEAQRYQLTKARIILATCITSARKIIRDFTNIREIIVDDGSHCSELECLVPIVWHPKVHQLVVLGDRQMPFPCRLKTWGQSLIHRLGDVAKTELVQQFRCDSRLCEFPASYFYCGMLNAADTTSIPISPIPFFPWPTQMGFHSLFSHIEGGQESVGPTAGGSGGEHHRLINKEEAAIVRNLVWSMVVKHQVNPTAILVLTFSPAQTGLIQDAVIQVGLNNVPVCTVSESLGRESQFVLVSTVRSVPPCGISHPPSASWIERHLGEVADPYLVNVALTRAQKALFIFGSKDLLCVCEPWKSLLDFYRAKQAIVTHLNV